MTDQDTSSSSAMYEMNGFYYSTSNRFTNKYGALTPGQLLYKSAQLKNEAITTGLLCGLASSALIGCSFLIDEPMIMYIPGAVIGFARGVASIALAYTSNKLMKEAGLKMERIQFSANGLTVKF